MQKYHYKIELEPADREKEDINQRTPSMRGGEIQKLHLKDQTEFYLSHGELVHM